MNELIDLIQNDPERMRVLSIVSQLGLPDCYVAAGFIRNLVWDSIYSTNTALNDIDIVFYNKSDLNNVIEKQISDQLNEQYPGTLWEAKNQAFMNSRNGDSPYTSSLDAMSYWPEKETAIGAALDMHNSITIVSAFGLEGLFSGKISHNKERSKDVFMKRVHTKKWLTVWPKLQVVL